MLCNKFNKRILFIGIPDMAYVCLDGLLSAGVNLVGVIGPKKEHGTYDSFKEFVLQRKLNFIDWDNLKSPDFIQKIKDLNCDAAVVCSFNYKIPKVLLESVKVGFLNIHPSLLPKYRGGNPYSNVIANGETETGVTIHFMDEGFDTGDIVMQVKVPLRDDETMGTLFNRLNLVGLEMLLEVLKKLEKQELPRYKQPEGEFIVGKSIKDADLFIDYNESAVAIERFIRALNPFLVASTFFRKNFVKVFSAEVVQGDASNYPIGSIAKIEGGKFYIATKDGFIAPTALQLGSFFIGTSKDFIRILNPRVGEEFK